MKLKQAQELPLLLDSAILVCNAMQQYDVNKNKRKIALLVSYIVMTLAVVAISVVCIFLALGYRFDFGSNKVEQGALLQFGTFPTNALVTLDGKILTFKTNGKLEVSAGPHDVTYHRDGYRDWTKHFTVKAGEVRWLTYARLVPTTIATDTVKDVGSVAEELPSPSKTHFALLSKVDTPTVTFLDVSDPTHTAVTSVTIPSEMLNHDGTTHSYHIVEWNLGSKFVLVRHDFASGHEYIRVSSVDQKDVINVSSKFGVALTTLHFSNETVFYGIENGNLRKFDFGSSSLSEPIVKDATSMVLYGSNELAYVRHAANKFEAGVVVDGQQRTVSTYDDTTPISIDLSQYFHEYYLAITRGGSFELVKNPERTAEAGMVKVVTLSYPSDLKWLDISSNGRFVITGNGAQFMVYDIELASRTDTNFPSLLADTSIAPQWIDDFTLVSTGDNKLRLSDFDGDNQQIITDALPALPVMLSSNSKVLYSFSKSSTGNVVLQSSKLTTD